MLIGEQGYEVPTHCDGCLPDALALAAKLRASSAPSMSATSLPAPPAKASSPTDPRIPKRWKIADLVALFLTYCKGTGRTYAWLIAKFTNDAITPATPAEFAKARDKVYSKRKRLAAAIEKHGFKWIKEGGWTERADGMPAPHAVVVLEPIPEAAA